MAIKEVNFYQASDNTLFTDSREAKNYQDNLNQKNYKEFAKKAFDEWLTKQLDVAKSDEPSEGSKLIAKIFSGEVLQRDSEEVLTEYLSKYGRDLNFLLADIAHSKGAKLPIRGEGDVLEMAKAG